MTEPLAPHLARDLAKLVQERVVNTILESAELFEHTPQSLGIASSAALEVVLGCAVAACVKGTGQRVTTKRFLDTWLDINADTIAQLEKEIHGCL